MLRCIYFEDTLIERIHQNGLRLDRFSDLADLSDAQIFQRRRDPLSIILPQKAFVMHIRPCDRKMRHKHAFCIPVRVGSRSAAFRRDHVDAAAPVLYFAEIVEDRFSADRSEKIHIIEIKHDLPVRIGSALRLIDEVGERLPHIRLERVDMRNPALLPVIKPFRQCVIRLQTEIHELSVVALAADIEE